MALPDLPLQMDDGRPVGTSDAAFCQACGRLWVAWGAGETLTEYVPVDPAARPIRSGRR